MADTHIRNPFEIGVEQIAAAFSDAGHAIAEQHPTTTRVAPTIHAIGVPDLRDALRAGLADLGAYRADLLFIGLVYPAAGLLLAQFAYGHSMLPLVFPLASGFALLGPVAAVGLYEISRRREQGATVTWADAFRVTRSPAFGSVVLLGLILVGLFLLWIASAYGLWWVTLGPNPPASFAEFARDTLTTAPGWAMIVFGVAVGAMFAAVSFVISVVSFPMLLDRNVGVGSAISTSVRVVAANPRTMAIWGLIVAGALVVGSLPALVGLIFAVPVLGHATWHLYRKVVTYPPAVTRY
jgi:uncharacterized membrane protein